MIVRISFASSLSSPRWGRLSLCLAVWALLFASCTTDEDTEPHVPSMPGATQPEGDGALLSEADACDRARSAAFDAYDRLGCDEPTFPECPAFLRPGGGSGCYEYREGSVEACEQAYQDATSCRTLGPCLVTAEQNLDLDTCEQVTPDPGTGGAGGVGSGVGGTDAGGAPPLPMGGADPGTGGVPTAQAGSPSAGAPASGGAN
jgi:hypothetical protein